MDALKITDFSEFIDILFEAENIFSASGEIFSKISSSFGITLVTVEISSVNIRNITETVYSDARFCEKYSTCYSFKYGNIQSMTVCINIHTCSPEGLTEEKKKSLEYISKIIYTFISKEKFEGIVANAGVIDNSTGLFTLMGFQKKILSIFSKPNKSQYSIIFMNIKNFKIVNRKYGHGEGTKIINQISKKLKVFLNDESFATYLGGDNFIAFVNNIYLPIFLKMISKFPVEAVNVYGKKEEYYVTFHAGVIKKVFLEPNSTLGDLSYFIENSQIAMNISKRNPSGQNIIYFDDEIKKVILREKEIECCMRDSLKNEEFFVCYQPKVDLNTYKLSGAEALVRWKKDGRIISPSSFIPLFEKNGFVCELDFYVLDCVCKKIRSWIENNIEPVKVSVNFSKLHTDNPNLVDDITDVIVKNGILPKYIEIEFTETSYMDDSKQIKDIITKLKDVGIMVSMDDFGTGYSSLNMLKEMPIDILKLDKSFLNSDGEMTKREEVIIKNVIRMAKELDIEVVSEGVETNWQVKFLQELECDIAQGYFFDRPLLEDDYEQRLKKMIYNDRMTADN